MPIPTLHFSEELPEVVRRELEQFVAQLRGYLLVSLNEDGSLRTQFNNDNSSIVINNETNADGSLKQRWDVAGPWTLDDPQAELDNVVGLRPPDPPAGTYHDYAPPGIDDAVCLEIEPTGNITLTGIKRMTLQARKRILLLRNRDSSATITLKHLNTGSLVGNRFDLPGNVDVLLDPGQNVWLYYDIGRAAWTAAITTQKAGGLNEGGASAGGDVSGPAGAVADNFASFDGVTGKLIKDSGFNAASFATTATVGISVTIPISQSQLENAGTTPVTLVAAAGSQTVIMPVAWWPEINLTTAYANNPSYSLAYAVNPTATQILATQLLGTNGAAPATKLLIGINNNPADHFLAYATTDVRNSNLVLRSTGGDLTGGGVATARIHLIYRVGITF